MNYGMSNGTDMIRHIASDQSQDCYTILVYWNATKFTRYEHMSRNDIFHQNGWVILRLSGDEELQIPSSTINRIVIKRES